ncbi:MAG: hypothetical protein A2Z27_06280 [candidate division Zixibacteria bacterium RBG_16_50_21]|nr:MAG: hypothetical protein A2Z27_06280 [candidate division Zixibacteria bacterium RBG_16_50_21]
MKRETFAIVLSLAVVALAGAKAWPQTPAIANQPSNPGKLFGLVPAKTFSLLDPSKLHIRNSYSFSYVSAGKYSGSFGLYQTSIAYQVASPLYLQVDLGYLHQPFGFKNNIDVGSRFFPNVHMLYRPGENFSLSINVLTGPSNNYNPYWYLEDR